MGFDPTTMHMLVREKTNDLLREAEQQRLANQALDILPSRPRRKFRLPFSIRLSLPLLRQRRNVAL